MFLLLVLFFKNAINLNPTTSGILDNLYIIYTYKKILDRILFFLGFYFIPIFSCIIFFPQQLMTVFHYESYT